MLTILPLSRAGGLVVLCLLLPFCLTAQKNNQTPAAQLMAKAAVRSATFSQERGTPAIIALNDLPATKQGATTMPELVQELFQLDPGTNALRFERATANSANLKVEKYRRLYQGVPVEHDRYNVLSTADGPRLITAESYDLRRGVNVQPTLTREAALAKALAYVGAEQYAWEQVEKDYVRHVWSRDLHQAINRELEAVKPGGELTIVDNYATAEVDVDLAWKFNVYAARPLSRAWIYVNAHSGEIMLTNRIIKHVSTPVSVETRYAGTRDIMVDLQTNGMDPHNGLFLLDSRTNLPASGPLYVLRDDTRGDGLETYDLNGVGGIPLSLPALYAQGKAFTDDDLNWTLAEHKRGGDINEADNDDIAWDAHWGTQVVYDYWLDVHGRNSYDDNGIAIKSFLHYGVAYDNAFWNGTAMTYGDGSYQGGANPDGTFAPLMSLDVCGHEIGHAICTFTADLVYARESGAMNEGFSDIWGAAIEAYVARSVDPSLAAIMNPWGIGEQIDERDGGIQYPAPGWQALRYMDEPGRAGDPDTYGGANWANPDCEPTLANDQCGVHTNSGVLNKWFYLMTAGESGTNDLGDNYSTSGLGFEISEKIAYGTELLLTPNATFAEARAASIAFVRTMTEAGGGECGNFEQQVTNSWYGVGVGPAFNCQQVAGFTSKQSFVSERVTDNSTCDASKIFTVQAAVVGNGRVSVTGTATRGKDFQIINPNFRAGPNGFAVHDFQIAIFDDAIIEGDETITLLLPGNNRHVVTLMDDDVELSPGATGISLLYETMRANNLPPAWSVVTMTGTANSWYSSANSGAYVGISTIGGGGLPTYNSVGDNDIILASPVIDARGMQDLSLSFDWIAGGETDVPSGVSGLEVEAVPFDYGNLAYSFDGVTWTDFTDFDPFVGTFISIASGNFSAVLPEFLEGTHFQLGWRWRNDANAGSPYSFSFENVALTGDFPGISTTTMEVEEELGPHSNFYFLSPDGRNIIAKISNNSSFNYGCTEVAIVTSGTGKNRCSGGIFMDKTFRITPSNDRNNSQLEITWYLSDAEIEGFEAATSYDRDDLLAFQTESFVCSGLSNTRTEASYLFVEEIPGGLAVITSFRSLEGYYSLGVEDLFLPVKLQDFSANNIGAANQLNWTTTHEENNEGFVIQRSATPDGKFVDLALVPAAAVAEQGADYQFIDDQISGADRYFYRLVQRDLDGIETPSDIRLVELTSKDVVSVTAFPNPTADVLNVRITTENIVPGTELELYNLSGQIVLRRPVKESVRLDLRDQPSGVYLLRVALANGTTSTRRIMKQ